MRTELKLPFPPSVNQLYSTNWKTKQRFKSKRYRKWIAEAGICLITQKRNKHPGKVVMTFIVRNPDNRRRDLGNLEKAVSDLLVAHQIIRDDSFIVCHHMAWSDRIEHAVVIIEDAA